MRSDFDLSFFVLGALTLRGPGEGLPTGGQLRAAQRQGGCLKRRESAAEQTQTPLLAGSRHGGCKEGRPDPGLQGGAGRDLFESLFRSEPLPLHQWPCLRIRKAFEAAKDAASEVAKAAAISKAAAGVKELCLL